MVQVNVRVEPSLFAALKRQAQKDKASVSAVVNDAIRNHLTKGSK